MPGLEGVWRLPLAADADADTLVDALAANLAAATRIVLDSESLGLAARLAAMLKFPLRHGIVALAGERLSIGLGEQLVERALPARALLLADDNYRALEPVAAGDSTVALATLATPAVAASALARWRGARRRPPRRSGGGTADRRRRHRHRQ
ncbi:MAG: hypothetical protein MZV65_35540 [Chromatiales bacterium]|nr:hypothetical protein [Chromatiales bacterium]